MTPNDAVPRLRKKSEYSLIFIASQAAKGWMDCLATARNAEVQAWECLTTTPGLESERLYRLKVDLANGTYDGMTYARYQYKLTDGAASVLRRADAEGPELSRSGLARASRHVASPRDRLTGRDGCRRRRRSCAI